MVRTMNNNKPLLLFCVPVLLTASLLSSVVVDGNGKIFDITHKISSELPTFDSKEGLGHFIWLVSSIKNGSSENASEFELGTHIGTHVDAPSHFFQQYHEEGFDVTTLSLQTLNGPALVVDVPRNHNITEEPTKPRSFMKERFRWFLNLSTIERERQTISPPLFHHLQIKTYLASSLTSKPDTTSKLHP